MFNKNARKNTSKIKASRSIPVKSGQIFNYIHSSKLFWTRYPVFSVPSHFERVRFWMGFGLYASILVSRGEKHSFSDKSSIVSSEAADS